MRVRFARTEDSSAVAEICNQGIHSLTATFTAGLRTTTNRLAHVNAPNDRYPILVAEADSGEVVGWGALSEHSTRSAYQGIAECSVYVEVEHRGRGVGTTLLTAVIDEARRLGYWKLLTRMFVSNEAGRALCLGAGFREAGVFERHARLEGRWTDVVVVERLIRENQD